ncbi:MAG: DUF493 domain-containing protein [Flavobacteriia bacterium]|jgi:hypothetical protein
MDINLDSLREKLDLLDWPEVYFFKFIVPNDSERVALVTALFDASSDIVMHPSKTGKYISISAKEMMLDVDSIIEKYKQASLIKDIISL